MSIVTRSLPVQFDLSHFVQFNRQRYPYALVSSALQSGLSKQLNANHLKASIGQYDIVFAFPQFSLSLGTDGKLRHKQFRANDSQQTEEVVLSSTVFFDEFNRQFQQLKCSVAAEDKSGLPFYGGWFVYLSYEMAGEVEPSLSLPHSQSALPLAIAVRIPAAIIHDRVNQTTVAVAETEYADLLKQIEADSSLISQQQSESKKNTSGKNNDNLSIAVTDFTEADEAPYLAQVERIKQYIFEGDIFQANLSRLWQMQLDGEQDDTTLFNLLAEYNPASFAALAVFDEATIISSSPERLVNMRDGLIETRPIAGTRPRSDNAALDGQMAEELMAHPKEQAEHIMLIDLERNDLGRVCVPGSIQVNELMALESWQHVHHIVSNIQGQCRQDKTAVDVLKAVFPGGTITGCPKVRCMEILAEQEQQARGAYTGSLGYINRDGDMDFNILIRTMVREQNTIRFRAGGGIVADSKAELELQETRAKARGLLQLFKLANES